MNEFPDRLRRLRERNRINRCALSELCGMDRNAIGRLENGKIEPTRKVLEGLELRLSYKPGRRKV